MTARRCRATLDVHARPKPSQPTGRSASVPPGARRERRTRRTARPRRHRRARRRRVRAAARQARRPADEPDRPIARRREHDRSARATRRASRSSRCSAPSTASAASSTTRSPSSRDEKTGLPIHSLYGDTQPADRRRCSTASTRIVVDLQDIGARFYTYPPTIALRDGGSREAEARRSSCSIGRTRSTASRSRGRSQDAVGDRLHRLPADADPARADARRARAAVQRRERRSAPISPSCR